METAGLTVSEIASEESSAFSLVRTGESSGVVSDFGADSVLVSCFTEAASVRRDSEKGQFSQQAAKDFPFEVSRRKPCRSVGVIAVGKSSFERETRQEMHEFWKGSSVTVFFRSLSFSGNSMDNRILSVGAAEICRMEI